MLEDLTEKLADAAQRGLDRWTPDEPVRNPLHVFVRRDPGAVLLNLPPYCQIKSFTCGLVAGLIVVHYLLPRRSARLFSKRIDPSVEWGVGQRRLVDVLRRTGVRVGVRYDLDFNAIAAAIDRGKPVIVTVACSEDVDHWLVIGGYARRPNRLYLWNESWLRTPACFRWREFKSQWDPVGVGLVCSKRNGR